MLLNLLANAIKHSPDDSRIEVRLRRVDSVAAIEVRDYGKGISAAELPYIFDRFYQGQGQQGIGDGLGLFLVHEIVTAHGGNVGVTSELGEGTTFTVRLPSLEPEADDRD